jgi:hypothetical protein
MNTISDQTVMVFAGTAARGSAIPSPSEGMVTYRSDDDIVEVFDGSSFVQVGSDPGLVATKTALKTDTFSASVTAGNSVDVTDLSITHTMSDASNKLVLMAYFGAAANSLNIGKVGLAVADDGTLIGIGDASSSRTRVGSGGRTAGTAHPRVVSLPSVHLLYSPGDTASHTYTVRAINIMTDTRTLYINRSNDDDTTANNSRAVSALTLMEVSV